MNNKRLVNALKKAGFQVETVPNENGLQVVNGPKYVLSWYVQDGNAVCVGVARHGDVSDAMTDYHAGFFVRTIKSAVQWISEAQ